MAGRKKNNYKNLLQEYYDFLKKNKVNPMFYNVPEVRFHNQDVISKRKFDYSKDICIKRQKSDHNKLLGQPGSSKNDNETYQLQCAEDLDIKQNKFSKDADPTSSKKGHNCVHEGLLLYMFEKQAFDSEIKKNSFIRSIFTDVNENLLNFCCRICKSGVITGVQTFLAHLIGRKHLKIQNSYVKEQDLIKIVFCKICKSIIYFKVALSEKEKRQEIFQGSIQDAINMTYSNKQKKAESNKTIPSNSCKVHIIISDINNVNFKRLFEVLNDYSTSKCAVLKYLYMKEDGSSALCCFKKRKNADFFNSNYIEIDERRYNAFIANIGDVNKFNKTQDFISWKEGELSPLFFHFFDKGNIFSSMNHYLEEMDYTESQFHQLTLGISEHLHQCINTHYKVNYIYFFGSRTTGLAVSDSDFDIALGIDQLKGSKRTVNVKTLANCLRGNPYFYISCVISGCKVPIIRLVHQISKSKCDVSLNNLNGVNNSKLIRLYLNLDKRVKWLVAAVKKWATLCSLRGSFQFTSYALTLLVFYFLMQNPYQIVPTIKTMEPFFNRLFERDYHNTEMILNEIRYSYDSYKCPLTEFQLMNEFFKYYSTLNPEMALDTYNGEPMSRDELIAKADKEPRNQFTNLTKSNLMPVTFFILLDPIRPLVNVCPHVNMGVLRNFTNMCCRTHNIFMTYK